MYTYKLGKFREKHRFYNIFCENENEHTFYRRLIEYKVKTSSFLIKFHRNFFTNEYPKLIQSTMQNIKNNQE